MDSPGGLCLLWPLPAQLPGPGPLDLAGGGVIERLVGAFLVEPEVGRQARLHDENTFIVFNVDIFECKSIWSKLSVVKAVRNRGNQGGNQGCQDPGNQGCQEPIQCFLDGHGGGELTLDAVNVRPDRSTIRLRMGCHAARTVPDTSFS